MMPRRSTDRLVLLLAAALVASPAAAPVAAQDFGVAPPAAANDWLSGKGRPPPHVTGWRPGDPIPPEAARRRPAAQAAGSPPSAGSAAPTGRPAIRTPGHAPGDWHRGMAAPQVATSAAVPPVGVTRLSDGNPDAKGALPADRAQLPRDLWGTAPGAAIADRIAATQPQLAATSGLFRRILTAQLAPPAGSAAGDEGRLFLARTDRLIALGWIEDAGALLQSAGSGDGQRFARRFDVALLTGDAVTVCRKITDRPGLAPGLAARVYCLAQEGDWAAAALTLHGARAAGLIPPQTVALLERFLDDSTADLGESLPDPAAVTPLEFRLFEAIGQPLATGGLPLAYAWTDLNGEAGWKARIEAAERLARAEAAPPETLAAAYLDQRPAASGGIWDRAAAFQRLDAALASGDAAALSDALPPAETLFAEAGLLVPLARMVAPRLQAGLAGPAAESAAHLRLLAGLPVPDAAGLPPADAALAALATGGGQDSQGANQPDGRDAGTGAEASPPAFPENSPGGVYAAALDAAPLPEPPPEGRGMALLAAMADVDAGLGGDVARAAGGLRRMVELGQEADARRAAVELLLIDHLGGPRR